MSKWPWTLQQLKTYIMQEWDQIPTPKLITSMPRRLQTVLKWRGDYTMVNMPPSQLFWVAGIKFEMSSFCAYHSKMYLFKHLCYLCSIMNIILAHVIWNSFNFILFKCKKRPNISGIRVVIICYKKKQQNFWMVVYTLQTSHASVMWFHVKWLSREHYTKKCYVKKWLTLIFFSPLVVAIPGSQWGSNRQFPPTLRN